MTAAIAQTAANAAVAQSGAQSHDTLMEMAKFQAKQRLSPEDSELFETYRGEVEQIVQSLPPQFQSNVNVWSNAITNVFGRHVSDIVKIRVKKGGAPSASGDGPSTPSLRGQPAPVKTLLTADEKDWARKWDISDDEYRHGKEILEDQDKHFGEVLTFDSKVKARKERARAAAK